MFCFLIIVVAVLALLGVQAYSVRGGQYNRSRHTASVIAYNELASDMQILQANFLYQVDHAALSVANNTAFTTICQNTVISDLYSPANDTSLRQVVVSVYWTDPSTDVSGGNQSFTVWTNVYANP